MPSRSLLSIAYREFVNAEPCQEIKFKQYIRSWTCLFRALFIFAGRMISNRLVEGGMDYYHVGFSQQREGYSMCRFICSIIRLAGCWFVSHTHYQNASLFHSVSYIQPYKHQHLQFLCRGKDNILHLRVQNRVNGIKNKI